MRVTAGRFVVGIVEAGGLFSVALEGLDADAIYAALDAEEFAWPLHASWPARKAAEEARDQIAAHIHRLGAPNKPTLDDCDAGTPYERSEDPHVLMRRYLGPTGPHGGGFCTEAEAQLVATVHVGYVEDLLAVLRRVTPPRAPEGEDVG